ncbi:DUF1453 domain-containing protein [Montanilutibacter psychrotolerans]|uniref:DUF1453 domain-containing protein n=1 Tax=Montanilutibacter psychrotolerans TaxID=1327343 RepID=A0A3M8SLU5_9GAMM|nr:DUF1453 domain-containing protein [Lysobacter psychrotolerans]RNF82199.1 DUF1453 domain-containing protein [Lysobacter psychrotolerans]
MPLLLIPLLLVVLVLLWLLLLPVAMRQRYRAGTARRRAMVWPLRINAFALAVSLLLLLVSSWLLGFWVEAALAHAAIGTAVGMLLGLGGLALTRFETLPQGWAYTPNRWLVLALSLLVAGRLLFGLVRGWQAWHGGVGHAQWAAQQGGMLAVAGLLLGYYLAYNWGLRRRLRRMPAVARDAGPADRPG